MTAVDRGVLSIVVPVLNEQQQLERLIPHLQYWRQRGCEVVVVDGGSQDGTLQSLSQCDVELISAARGRASQQHAGAGRATGDYLLFLHADTLLPEDADSRVRQALQHHSWGRFNVQINGRHCMLKVIARMMNLRSCISKIATGDQAIFMHKQVYWQVGGFDQQPLMEDIEMSKKLKALGRPACVAAKVVTSGRRWETRGVWTTIFLMWQLRWQYWRGVSAEVIAARYR